MSNAPFDAGARAAGSIASSAKQQTAMRLNQEINDSMVRMRTGVSIEEQTAVRKKMFESGIASLSTDERSKIGVVLTDAQAIQVISHDREQFAQSRHNTSYDKSMEAEFRANSVQNAIDNRNFNYTNTSFQSQQAANNFIQDMRSKGFYALDADQQNGQWVVQTATSVSVPVEDKNGIRYEEYSLMSSENADGSYSFSTVVDGYKYSTDESPQQSLTKTDYNNNADFLSAVSDYNSDKKNENFLASEYIAPEYKTDYDLYEEEQRHRREEANAAFGYMSGQFGRGVGELGWVANQAKEAAGYMTPFIKDMNAEHILHSDNPFTQKATVIGLGDNSGDKLIYVKGQFQGKVGANGSVDIASGATLSESDLTRIYNQDLTRHASAELTQHDIAAHESTIQGYNVDASAMGQKEADKFLADKSKEMSKFAVDKKYQAEKAAFEWNTVNGHKPTAISVGVYDSKIQRRQFMNRQLVSRRNESIKRTAATITNGAIQTYNIDALAEIALVEGGYSTMLAEQLAAQNHALSMGALEKGDLLWFRQNGLLASDGTFNINAFRDSIFDAATKAGVDIGGIGGFNMKKINALSSEELQRIGRAMGKNGMSVDDLRRHLQGFASDKAGFSSTGRGAGSFLLSKAQQAIGDEDLNAMVNHGTKAVKYGKKGYTIGKDFATSVSYEREALLKRKAAQGSELHKKKLEQLQAKKAKWAQQNTKLNANANKWAKMMEQKRAAFVKNVTANKKLAVINKYNPFVLAENAKRKAAQMAAKKLMSTKLGQAAAKLAAKAAAKLGLASTGIGAVVAIAWEILDHLKEILAMLAVKAAISIAAAIMPVICGFVVLAFVVLNIAGLFEDDDPESYHKTAAYQLNEKMQEQEEKWLKGLQDGISDDKEKKLFKKRDKITWGWDNEEWDEYIKHFKNLEVDGDDLYINPFWRVEGLATKDHNKEVLKKVETFDGKKTAELFANPSIYSELEIKDEKSSESGESGESGGAGGTGGEGGETEEPESYKDDTIERRFCGDGNTSNVRDVLAMTDIMYTHEPEDNPDEQLESIFDVEPSYYTKKFWENIWTNVLGFFASLFGEGEEFKPAPVTGFTTIQNYVTHLFNFSHAQVFAIDVSYYNKEIPKIKLEGEEKTLKEAFEDADGWFDGFGGWDDLTDSDAAKLGFCKELSEIELEIDVIKEYSELPDPDEEGDIKNGVVDKEITPVIKDEDDNIYGTGKKDRFDITITIDDLKKDDDEDPSNDEKPCLWEGMGSNLETYDKIRECDCWSCEGEKDIQQKVIPDDISYEEACQIAGEIYGRLSENSNQEYCLKDKNTFEVNKLYDFVATFVPDYMGGGEWHGYIRYREERWTRSCHKHTFTYAAGQLDLKSYGLVNSFWNEHQAIGAGQYPDDYCNPVYLKENVETDTGLREPAVDELDKIGFEEIIGKVDLENADESSIANYVGSTKGKSPDEDAQGSYIGSEKGVNMLIDGDYWAACYTGDVFRWLKEDEEKELQEKRLMMRDIFDIDMFIPKGYNIFPYTKDEWSSYEAWSADNILLATTRLTGDWYEYFNFDIPSNVGERTLAEEDIDKIIENIKATGYLSEDDEKRETVVKAALFWVGRGHYSEFHNSENTDHEFLTKVCTVMKQKPEGAAEDEEGVGWDMISTASDSEGFAHWLYHIADKSDKVKPDGESKYSSFSDCKAGDIIVHKAYETDDKGVLDLTIFDMKKKDIKNFDADAVGSYTHDVYSIVIGETQETIRTKGNIEIPAGSQLIVQMDTNGMYGSVRLRCYKSEGYFDHIVGEKKKGIFIDTLEYGDTMVARNYKGGEYDSDTYEITKGYFDKEKDYNRVHYYWIENPDDQTKVIKFGT